LVIHHTPKQKTPVDLSNLERANTSSSPSAGPVASASSAITHLGVVNLNSIGFVVLLVFEL
jgi:hypothetical protein